MREVLLRTVKEETTPDEEIIAVLAKDGESELRYDARLEILPGGARRIGTP